MIQLFLEKQHRKDKPFHSKHTATRCFPLPSPSTCALCVSNNTFLAPCTHPQVKPFPGFVENAYFPVLAWGAGRTCAFKKHGEPAQSFETKVQQIGDNEIWSNLKPAHELPKRNLQLVWLSDTPLQLFWRAGPRWQDKELIDSIVSCMCKYKLKCIKDRGTRSSADRAQRLCCLTARRSPNKRRDCPRQTPRDPGCIIPVPACPTVGCAGSRVADWLSVLLTFFSAIHGAAETLQKRGWSILCHQLAHLPERLLSLRTETDFPLYKEALFSPHLGIIFINSLCNSP